MLRFTSLAADVQSVTGETYDSTAYIFHRGDDVLLVDALGGRDDAAELRRHFQSNGKRVRFIVSTHYFSDHMAALALFHEAEVIAHENYAQTFAEERFRSDEEAGFFVTPAVTFNDRLTIRWGAHTLALFHNPGHTTSTIGVDVPSLDLLHVGDTVVGNIVYLGYGTPEAIESAVTRARGRGRATIATSHADPQGNAVLDHALHYLDALRAKRGRPLLDDCLPRGVQGSDFENIFHQRNLDEIEKRGLFA